MKTFVLLLCVVVAASAQSCTSAIKKLCSDHTLCKYPGPNCPTSKYSGVTSAADKQAVVDAHNRLRSRVANGQETIGSQPPAANMNKIQWDDSLAAVAQRWADQCNYGHDSCRNDPRFYVGQNVYQGSTWGSPETGTQDWNAAVQAWYDEVKDFDSQNIKPFEFSSETGHYTQVVWANTKYVGCGFVAYEEDGGWYSKFYVCNYGPGGNIIGTTMYDVGTACSKCSGKCDNGLCVA